MQLRSTSNQWTVSKRRPNAQTRDGFKVSPISSRERQVSLEGGGGDNGVRKSDARLASNTTGAFGNGPIDTDLSKRSK